MRTFRRLPMLVASGAGLWAAVGGLLWWQWSSEQATPVALNDAALAAIEPAAGGGSGHGEDGTAKKGGTDDSLPVVKVGNLTITTAQTRAKTAVDELMPKGLLDPSIQMELQRRFKFTPYAHNPTRGPDEAPVTLVEFSDLACGQCRKDMTAADKAQAEHPDDVREVAVHLPLARFSDTNLLAFYGKVAQRGGKYWEYRQHLLDKGSDTANKDAGTEDTDYADEGFAALQAVGMNEAQVRRWVTREARRYYRELDADAALARALGLDQPPHFYVNGVHVGDQGIARDRLGDLVTWTLVRHDYQIDDAPPRMFRAGNKR